MRTHTKQKYSKLVDEIKTDVKKNKEDFERGLFIKEYIQRHKIDPKILRPEHQKALKKSIDSPLSDVVLKPWQEELLKPMKSRVPQDGSSSPTKKAGGPHTPPHTRQS